MTGRRPLDAHVSGPAAVWVLRRLDLADVRRSIASFRATGRADLAAALEDAYLDLHEAGRQWLASRDEGATTDLGSPVTPREDDDASFKWVDCPGAAAELGVSERRARQLVAGGLLTGRKVGGKWLIDRDDVARLAGDRRLTA